KRQASREREIYNAPDATLPACAPGPRSSAPAWPPASSAAPHAREIHFSPCHQGYESSPAPGPASRAATAATAIQSPWPTYYSYETLPSKQRSNPASPPPREKISLLPLLSALSE